ncbi:MAG: DUF2817 domain-containing protein [Micrococcales bacterium]|nr:DUF2817 domain-containing protein [Micrococcales bacterium]
MRRTFVTLCLSLALTGGGAAAWAEDTPTPTPTPTDTVTPTPTPTPTPTITPAPGLPKRLVLGQSRKGRPIVATRQGEPDADRVLLVLGQMHGDEPYGRYVVDRLRKLTPRKGTAIWTIRTINPDGAAMRTRRNANRVDLNRNFPGNWQKGSPGSLYYSGPRPASEPETKALMTGVEQIRPDAVVSYHQHLNVIDRGTHKKVRKWVRRLSDDLRLPVSRVSCVTKCAGTMTGWFNTTYKGWAVTVELPRRIPAARQRSMARAMVNLVPDLKPTQKRP